MVEKTTSSFSPSFIKTYIFNIFVMSTFRRRKKMLGGLEISGHIILRSSPPAIKTNISIIFCVYGAPYLVLHLNYICIVFWNCMNWLYHIHFPNFCQFVPPQKELQCIRANTLSDSPEFAVRRERMCYQAYLFILYWKGHTVLPLFARSICSVDIIFRPSPIPL